MSESTVQRIVVDLKIRNTYQKPKEKLSVEQKLNRVKFARNILKSELILFPWVFSDESMIILDETKKIKVFPIIDNPQYYYNKTGYPKKIMIWACVAYNYKSPLILIDGKLNSEKYIDILQKYKIFDSLRYKSSTFRNRKFF